VTKSETEQGKISVEFQTKMGEPGQKLEMFQNIDTLVATKKPNYAALGYKMQNERSDSPAKRFQSGGSATRKAGHGTI